MLCSKDSGVPTLSGKGAASSIKTVLGNWIHLSPELGFMGAGQALELKNLLQSEQSKLGSSCLPASCLTVL